MAFVGAASGSSVVSLGPRFQPHVGDVCHPELICGHGNQPASDIDRHFEIVFAVRCLRNETAFANGQQSVLQHQTRRALVIDLPALRPQCMSDPAIAVLAAFDRYPLHGIAEP
jgi:hypothetical protein